MFSNKPNYLKLRTNLRLSINRLKLLEKKKTELALKARREIADYIAAGKDDRARIRVEHIIREDYLVEAMEIVEMLCDLLLARFGLIEKMSELDPGIEEAVATLIWVSPRLYGDIQEMREVAHQLTIKYGKEFAEMCRRNGFESVNEKVMHKMSLAAPPKLLVEHYMIEIARTYKVPFEPDPLVMMGQPPEVNNLIDLGVDALSPSGGSTNSSTAELKALEAGQVAGGSSRNQFPMPSVPGSTSGGPGVTTGAGSQPFSYNVGISRGGTTSGGPGMMAGAGSQPFSYNAGISSGGSYGAGGLNGFGSCAGGASGSSEAGGEFGYGLPRSGSGSAIGGMGYGYGSSAGVRSSGGSGTAAGIGVCGGTGTAVDSECPTYESIGGSTIGGFPDSNFSEKNIAGIFRGNVGDQHSDSLHGDKSAVSGSDSRSILTGPGSSTNKPGSSDADYSAALIGGVPVLPSEGQFPPPVPPGYLPPSGVVPSHSHPSQPPNTNQADNQKDGHGGSRAGINPQMSWINDDYLPSLPPYEEVVSSSNQYPVVQPNGANAMNSGPTVSGTGKSNIYLTDVPTLPDVPGFPSVPSNSLGGATSGDDVDFDDLTRRFEELKRRK